MRRVKKFVACFIINVLLLGTAVPVGADVIDYSSGYDYFRLACFGTNGIGETFVPSQGFVTDVSIFVIPRWVPAGANCTRPWGSDAHLEIYSGLPGFDGSGGNVLFRSSRIDFESLPIVAVITPQGEDSLYIGEVKASNLGLVKPIPVTVDSIYSLVLADYGNCDSTRIQYTSHSNNVYPSGEMLLHGAAGDCSSDWRTSSFPQDLAFRVVTEASRTASVRSTWGRLKLLYRTTPTGT